MSDANDKWAESWGKNLPTSHEVPRVGSDVRSGQTKAQRGHRSIDEAFDEWEAEARAEYDRAVELRDAWREWGNEKDDWEGVSLRLIHAIRAILVAHGLRLDEDNEV